jgi:hypothetical protein
MISVIQIQKGPKKIGNYNQALKISTEDLAPFLERNKVLLPFSRKPTSNSDDGRRPSAGTKPLGPEQEEKRRTEKGEADGSG